MLNIPLIDTHVHLWNPETFAIDWLAGNSTLDQRFLLDEFAAHSAGVPVEAFVYVEVGMEPAFALAEARFVAALAERDPRLRG
ncbi:MAG: amidohydrolase, partial [Chloroflexales bacterium]|nr:amidohydrolase [Chloroflexales bacterium]